MSNPTWRELERDKYTRVWGGGAKNYRAQNDGLPAVEPAFDGMGCQPGESLIDWGTGSGQSAQWFQDKGLEVTGFDIAANCLNEDIDIKLVVGCIWEPPTGLEADYAFCTDVLEHIPPEYVEQTLDVLHERSRKAAFLQVDTELDISGPMMNPPEVLHLCVRRPEWWERLICARWREVVVSHGQWTRWRFLCRD